MVVNLLQELRAQGVVLSIANDGRMTYDAPADTLSDELLGRMRAERDGLLALIEREQERAAIFEHGGGGADYDTPPEPMLLAPMTGAACPWCRSAVDLVEIVDGLHCANCNRCAWRFEDDGAMVRCDCLEPRLAEVSAKSVDPAAKIRPRKSSATSVRNVG